jgi:hypothetical protein
MATLLVWNPPTTCSSVGPRRLCSQLLCAKQTSWATSKSGKGAKGAVDAAKRASSQAAANARSAARRQAGRNKFGGPLLLVIKPQPTCLDEAGVQSSWRQTFVMFCLSFRNLNTDVLFQQSSVAKRFAKPFLIRTWSVRQTEERARPSETGSRILRFVLLIYTL